MATLVTGGGGFLGLYIVELLRERGESVRVLCRGDYPRLDEVGATTFHGDVRDAEFVEKVVAGCETVFHVASVPGIWGRWKHFYEINTLGTLNVLKACQKYKVAKLIYTSSPSVVFDGTPHLNANESLPYPKKYLCHYPHTKALAEQAVLKANGEEGLATCALRPHLIWGPRDNHLIPRLIQRAKSGQLWRVGDGENQVSMSYVENVAQAHLQAADRLVPDSPVAGQAYFLNEPEPVKLWHWIDDLIARAGLSPIKKNLSAKAAYPLGAVLEGIYKVLLVKTEPPMTRFLALQLSQSHTYDISKAQRDFGYEPKISMTEGMKRIEPELEFFGKKTTQNNQV
jgi:nucleoside-diphosphate-sugar epimerase